jgi:hypothetical protein
MDISNILVVVQWRATCSLSTLWQRFGRAARDRSLEAVAVEKEHFDSTRESKAAKQAKAIQKKRKRTQERVLSPSKRQNISVQSSAPPCDPVESVSDGDASGVDDALENERDEELQAKYTDGSQKQVGRKSKKREIEESLDDLINAEARGLGCCRRPVNIYFKNKDACESSRLASATQLSLTRLHMIDLNTSIRTSGVRRRTCNRVYTVLHSSITALLRRPQPCRIYPIQRLFYSNHPYSSAL